ncbi:hypothetical protein [Salmonella phage SilasIsHot]|uniref:Uncharacterized protein n=1 Tax=Salmonella phage maane TaxID=2713304 RepID=A0A6G8RQU1_9CAUD|nr:hypothetical protein HYQ38_gp178 [Salmonella phage maane]ECW1086663.1 hypothetical protein [Salmonella enterica]QIO03585.1 hypothetical protein maane_178 [Salmonella phage maane]QPX74921.1 hypothetical protein [Salmonella phage SilasIsHot]
MIYLLFVVPIILAILFVVYHRKTHEPKETLIATAIVVVLSCLIQAGAYAAFSLGSSGDVEILNGYVTDKQRNKVGCSHSYECMCYYTTSCSGSGNNRSCTQTRHCSTCYEHSYDVDWDVLTTVGDLSIDRIDRQGTTEPPRWAQVKIGEPAAREHSYMNYVLGNKDSLFSKSDQQFAEKFKEHIPSYPRVYDYYRVTRVLNMSGMDIPVDYWNDYLNNTLKTLGASRQVNIVWVVTSGQPVEYFQGLLYAWSGGKKNDVIVVTDISKDMKINWGKSTSFADGMNNMELHSRNGLSLTGKPMGISVFQEVAVNISKGYNRVEMKEMDYLKWRDLKTWEVIIVVLLGCVPFTAIFILGHMQYNGRTYKRLF